MLAIQEETRRREHEVLLASINLTFVILADSGSHKHAAEKGEKRGGSAVSRSEIEIHDTDLGRILEGHRLSLISENAQQSSTWQIYTNAQDPMLSLKKLVPLDGDHR